ncbi:MAG: glycosyltransferase family 39 protein [Acidobacteriota bacterium]
MPEQSSQTNDTLLTTTACMVMACLVWYKFDVIGLDAVESLHVVASQTPLSYLLAWTTTVEVHPPYFYILLKALYGFLFSDFGVKSVFALSTFGTLYYASRTALLSSRGAASLCICLLAVNPLLIEVSRSLRPHIAIIFCITAALYHSIRYTLLEQRKDKYFIFTSCILGMALHYMFAIYLISQTLILVLFRSKGRMLARIKLSAGVALVSAAPIAYFYASSTKASQNMLLSKLPYPAVASEIAGAYTAVAKSVCGLAFPGELPGMIAIAVCCAAVLYATFRAMKKCDFLLRPLLLLLIFPAIFLLASRHGFVFYKYIPQALIALVLLLSMALGDIAGRWRHVIGYAILFLGSASALSQSNLMTNYTRISPFKAMTPTLSQLLTNNTLASFSDDGQMESYNYYYNQAVAHNYILDNAISPDMRTVDHILVGNQFYQKSITEYIAEAGEPDSASTGPETLRTWSLPRKPVTSLASFPARFQRTMVPGDFLTHVNGLERIMFYSNFGDGVSPTRIGQPGTFRYAFENTGDGFPHYIAMTLDYENSGQDGVLLVKTTFDDEEKVTQFGSAGPDPVGRAFLEITRDRPFRFFTVEFELLIKPITPKYPNWNHGLTRVKSVDVGFYDTSEQMNVYPASFNRHRQGASFTADMSRLVPANVVKAGSTGLASFEEARKRIYKPSGAQPAEMELVLQNVPAHLVFFPRVSGGDSSIRVFETTGGRTVPVFQIHGIPGEWSPQQEGYHFLTPISQEKTRTFTIRLEGNGSQLWDMGDGVLYAIRKAGS